MKGDDTLSTRHESAMKPFVLSLSKHERFHFMAFDKLRPNGVKFLLVPEQ